MLVLLFACIVAVLAFAARRRLAAVVTGLLLLLFPLVVLDVGGVAIRLVKPRAAIPAILPPAQRLPARASRAPRAVWIIFDELDYLVDLSADGAIPEFHHMRKEALFAQEAVSPATDTIPSIPVLLDGKSYARFDVDGAKRLLLAATETEPLHRWQSRDTVFAAARQMGFNTAVAGFYIPYCGCLTTS